MMRRVAISTALAVLAAAAPVRAELQVPYLAGRVTDEAGMLSSQEKASLEGTLAAFEQQTGAQLAVLTIPSLEGEPIEDYSMRVAETWKLGQKGKDNGVLFLIARDDRKMRLEVGYGLEPVLTDALSRRILDDIVRPRFRAGDYAAGIQAGSDAVIASVEGKELPEAPEQPTQEVPWPARIAGGTLFIVVVGTFSLLAVFGSGCQSWFLYLFLMPFWLTFPGAFAGWSVGVTTFLLWVVLFPVAKLFFGKSTRGKSFLAAHPGLVAFATSSGGHGGSGGGWSSGGFSGGGGSFGGGGASSSW